MGISRQQKAGVSVVCSCGCGKKFVAFPVYANAKIRSNIPGYTTITGDSGATLYVSKYKRGHSPSCRKAQTGNKPAWNKGLTKEVCPTLLEMGFQKGENHWNYREELNPDWFSNTFDYVAFSKGFSTVKRSRGFKKIFGKFRDAILERDNRTCQDCGYIWDESSDPNLIHVHHWLSVKSHPELIFAAHNVVTLCRNCHWKYHKTK